MLLLPLVLLFQTLYVVLLAQGGPSCSTLLPILVRERVADVLPTELSFNPVLLQLLNEVIMVLKDIVFPNPLNTLLEEAHPLRIFHAVLLCTITSHGFDFHILLSVSVNAHLLLQILQLKLMRHLRSADTSLLALFICKAVADSFTPEADIDTTLSHGSDEAFFICRPVKGHAVLNASSQIVLPDVLTTCLSLNFAKALVLFTLGFPLSVDVPNAHLSQDLVAVLLGLVEAGSPTTDGTPICKACINRHNMIVNNAIVCLRNHEKLSVIAIQPPG